MRSIRYYVFCLVHEPLTLLCIILLTVVFLLPLLLGNVLYGDIVADYNIASAREAMETNLSSGVFDALPPEQVDEYHEQYSLLLQAYDATSRSMKYKNYSEYCRHRLNASQNASSVDDLIYWKAEYAYASEVAALSLNEPIYTSSDLPGISYVSYLYGSIPFILWLIPSALVSALLSSYREKASSLSYTRTRRFSRTSLVRRRAS